MDLEPDRDLLDPDLELREPDLDLDLDLAEPDRDLDPDLDFLEPDRDRDPDLPEACELVRDCGEPDLRDPDLDLDREADDAFESDSESDVPDTELFFDLFDDFLVRDLDRRFEAFFVDFSLSDSTELDLDLDSFASESG